MRLVNGKTVKGTMRYISRDASSPTRTFRVEVAIPNPRTAVPAGMTAEITLQRRADRRGHAAALGGDAERQWRSRHPCRRQGQQGGVLSRSTWSTTRRTGWCSAAFPTDARIIVAGQELVTEGDEVKPVEADQATIKKLIGEATDGT